MNPGRQGVTKESRATMARPARVPVEVIERFMLDVFVALGVPPEEARICTDVLIASDVRGIESHGIGRLKYYYDRITAGIQYPQTRLEIVKETETTALLDGNLGLGLYVGPYAMEMAIRKAKTFGIGFVAVKNSTHYGIAGYYVTMATDAGCIGFSGTNARPSIAPTFGVEPMLGMYVCCYSVRAFKLCSYGLWLSTDNCTQALMRRDRK